MSLPAAEELSALATLRTDLLYVFVAGPGKGEGIAVAFPGGDWLFVDGCRTSDTFPLRSIFDRFTWDTMLREAYVVGGGAAGKDVVTGCSGKWLVGGLSLETVYVSFQRGKVAAVKMINSPPFFAKWAASIRHEALGAGKSRIIYTWNFSAKPRALAWLLEPVMALFFRWETRKRLKALRRKLSG